MVLPDIHPAPHMECAKDVLKAIAQSIRIKPKINIGFFPD
jgi:hypothetical protein